MTKYVSKPDVCVAYKTPPNFLVEASPCDIRPEWVEIAIMEQVLYLNPDTNEAMIKTVIGDDEAVPDGDYIVSGCDENVLLGHIYTKNCAVFETSYEPVKTTDLSFSEAVLAIEDGKRVKRSDWNGPDQYIFMVPGSTFEVNREPLLSMLGEGTEVDYSPHVDLKNQQGGIAPWFTSNGDFFSKKWEIVDSSASVDSEPVKTDA